MRGDFFAWKFTELLSNQIYTLSQSLVEIYRKVTKLCCFNQDNPNFSVFESHVELTEQNGFVDKTEWPSRLKLSRFEPSGV